MEVKGFSRTNLHLGVREAMVCKLQKGWNPTCMVLTTFLKQLNKDFILENKP